MNKIITGTIAALILAGIGIGIVVGFYLLQHEPALDTVETKFPAPSQSPAATTTPDLEPYAGKNIVVTNGFTVSMPNGWRASVSTAPRFLGVQFARPGEISALVYKPDSQPTIDYNGIPAWSGLTEHFYIRRITDPQQTFSPDRHKDISSTSFTFADGTVGKLYEVTKSADEATQWGGLLKDDRWFGKVYSYERDGKIVEAHLAYYPSTKIDIDFFAKVARSIKL